MPTSEVSDADLRALVHVAGPPETETDDDLRAGALGYVWVQRCLRCDDLLAIWRVKDRPGNAFRIGRLIAADPYSGIAGGREVVDSVGRFDKPCSPIPLDWL